MEQLRDTIVETFTSAFVETIVMERAKLESYDVYPILVVWAAPWFARETRAEKEGQEC